MILNLLAAIGGLALAATVVVGALALFCARWEDEDADARIERQRGRANRP